MILIHPALRQSPFLRKRTCKGEERAGVEGGGAGSGSALPFSSSVMWIQIPLIPGPQFTNL